MPLSFGAAEVIVYRFPPCFAVGMDQGGGAQGGNSRPNQFVMNGQALEVM